MNNNPQNRKLVLIAETNFILDVAFEQSDECKRLLDFIHKSNISLVIPEYSFAESEGSILAKIQNRLSAIESALAALRQASRSDYSDLNDFIIKLQEYKDSIEQNERKLVIQRKNFLEEISIVIPLTSDAMVKSELRSLKRIAPFKQTDRIIYESILEFAKQNQDLNIQILFLTRDKDDFDVSAIREELDALNIEIFFSAGECIKRIKELTDTDLGGKIS